MPTIERSKIKIMIEGHGKVTSENVFGLVKNEPIALILVSTEDGRKLLSESKIRSGYSALHSFIQNNEKVAEFLIKESSDCRNLLAYDKRDDGWSSLHTAVTRYEKVALALIEMPGGVELLSKTLDDKGTSALHSAVNHNSVAIKLIATPEGRKILNDTKDNRGVSALHVANEIHNGAVLTELLRIVDKTG